MSCCDIVNGSFNKLPINYPCSGNKPSNWSNYANKSIISASSNFLIGNHKSNVNSVREAYSQIQTLKQNNPKLAKMDINSLKAKSSVDLMSGDSSTATYLATYNGLNSAMNISLNNINQGLGFSLSIDDIINCDLNKKNNNEIYYNNIKNYININKSIIILFIFVIILIILIVYIYKKRINVKISNIDIVNK